MFNQIKTRTFVTFIGFICLWAGNWAYGFNKCSSVTLQSLLILQDERTLSPEKLSILNNFPEEGSLQECLQHKTKKEPLMLTLLDLSRHSNKALAVQAQALLTRFNLTQYINEELNSQERDRQTNIIYNVLFRIEPRKALAILDNISFPSNVNKEDVQKEINSGVSKVLVPTDSPSGDRYYVRAEWDASNTETIDCLAELFNRELVEHDRTLEQEKASMQTRGKPIRQVYWYSKDWVLYMSQSINECGGVSSFVRP